MQQEQQQEELQALEVIYPQEITIISDTHFKICLDSLISSLPNSHTLTLEINYTQNYPDELPIIHLISQDIPDDDLTLLLDHVQTASQEFIGIAMIYSIIETIITEFSLILDEKQKSLDLELHQKLLAEELAQTTLFTGTKVTVESFNNWRHQLCSEIISLKNRNLLLTPAMQTIAAAAKLFPSSKSKLTGRQLFEKDSSLATADVQLLDENDVAVDITLFEGLEDLDGDSDNENLENNLVLAGLTDD